MLIDGSRELDVGEAAVRGEGERGVGGSSCVVRISLPEAMRTLDCAVKTVRAAKRQAFLGHQKGSPR